MPDCSHIGIVSVTAEGAALCYKTIVKESAARLGAHVHPEISLHSISFSRYEACLDAGDLDGVAALLLSSARKLAAIGADFLVCPSNTPHEAFPRMIASSPLPWLHIAEVVAAEASTRGYRRIGLTGTQWLVSSQVYPQALEKYGLTCVRPDDAQCCGMGQRIRDELVCGIFSRETTAWFQQVIEDLAGRGCDAVILGCTEIPLIIDDGNSPLPTLDSTRLLARAATLKAISQTGHTVGMKTENVTSVEPRKR